LIQLSFNTLLAHQIQNFHEEKPYSTADFSNPDESVPVLSGCYLGITYR